MTDLERELRAALFEVDASAAEPIGLADRLVAGATASPSRPHRVGPRRSPRWVPPLLAAAAVIAVTVATAVVVTSTHGDRQTPATPNPGLTTPLIAPQSLLDVREFGFHVADTPGIIEQPGWNIDQYSQSVSVEWTNWRGEDVDLIQVSVYYRGKQDEGVLTGSAQPVTVHRAPGYFDVEDGNSTARLAWQYAPNSWAQVSVNSVSLPPEPQTRAALLTVAEAVSPGGPVIRLPFRVAPVPASFPPPASAYSLSFGTSPLDPASWSAEIGFGDPRARFPYLAVASDGDLCNPAPGHLRAVAPEPFTYRGHPGCLIRTAAGGPVMIVALDVAGKQRTIEAFAPDSVRYPLEDVKQVLAELTVAPDDPGTWFDLKTALSG